MCRYGFGVAIQEWAMPDGASVYSAVDHPRIFGEKIVETTKNQRRHLVIRIIYFFGYLTYVTTLFS